MTNKVIAVQEGLHDIAEKLKDLGYQVVGVDETNRPLDAIVYSTELSGSPTKVRQEEEPGFTNSAVDNDGMVFMINADEHSMDELIARINNI